MGWFDGWSCDVFGWMRCPAIPRAYTVPGALYAKNDRVDRKKLRKLILDGRLCPLFPGCEEGTPPPEHDQYADILARLLKRKGHMDAAAVKEHLLLLGQAYEACPICFLHYPALNTSKCCNKRICTECYLQVQTTRSAVPSCPFCKLPGYSAKFLGLKTVEEREQERLEEQKVIEARIREREEEVRRDQEREAQRLQQQQQREEQRQQQQAAAVATGGSLPAGAGTADAAGAAGAVASVAAVEPPSPTNSSDTWQSAVASGLDIRTPTHGQQQPQHQQQDGAGLSPLSREARQERAGTGTGSQAQAAGARGHSPARMRVRPGGSARAGQGGGAGPYRWADYMPTGVMDISLDVEDLNTLMLEQAMYESIAVAGNTAPGPASSTSPHTYPPQQHHHSSTSSPRSSGAHALSLASRSHHSGSPRARVAHSPLPSPRARGAGRGQHAAAGASGLAGRSQPGQGQPHMATTRYSMGSDSDSDSNNGPHWGGVRPDAVSLSLPPRAGRPTGVGPQQQLQQQRRPAAAASTMAVAAAQRSRAVPAARPSVGMVPDELTEEQQLELAIQLSLADTAAGAHTGQQAPATQPAASHSAAAAPPPATSTDSTPTPSQPTHADGSSMQGGLHCVPDPAAAAAGNAASPAAAAAVDADDSMEEEEEVELKSMRSARQPARGIAMTQLQLPPSPTPQAASQAQTQDSLPVPAGASATISPVSPFLPVLPTLLPSTGLQTKSDATGAMAQERAEAMALQSGLGAEPSSGDVRGSGSGALISAVHAAARTCQPGASVSGSGGQGLAAGHGTDKDMQQGPGVTSEDGCAGASKGDAWHVGQPVGEGTEHAYSLDQQVAGAWLKQPRVEGGPCTSQGLTSGPPLGNHDTALDTACPKPINKKQHSVRQVLSGTEQGCPWTAASAAVQGIYQGECGTYVAAQVFGEQGRQVALASGGSQQLVWGGVKGDVGSLLHDQASAASVAASQAPTEMHLELVFVVWDPEARAVAEAVQPTGTAMAVAPAAAAAQVPSPAVPATVAVTMAACSSTAAATTVAAMQQGSEQPLAVCINASSSTTMPHQVQEETVVEALISMPVHQGLRQRPYNSKPAAKQPQQQVVLVQNPDGSSVCAVCDVRLTAAPQHDPSLALPAEYPDPSNSTDAALDAAAHQLLREQDQEVAQLEQAIAAAEYGDYDVQPPSDSMPHDVQLAASIRYRDAQLMQAYQRSS